MKILMYHSVPSLPSPANPYSVPVAQFCEQMELLASRNLTVTSLEDALDHSLPDDWVVLTFDDAYKTVLANAAPILADLGFRATVFVPTGCVGGTNLWDSGEYAEEPIAGWDDLMELNAAGIAIGSHTVTHARFTRLSICDRYREIMHSKRALEERLGTPIRTFSYPYGANSRISELIVRLAGYHAAVVGAASSEMNSGRHRFRLRRIQIEADTDLNSFVAKTNI